MNNNDEAAKEMMDLVMDVTRYAHENSLDITNKEDVMKTLEAVRPEKVNTVNLDTLVEGLVAFDQMAKTEQAKRQEPENN